jgi:glucose-6-phosphate 1-dehydrogenase
VTLDRVVIFGAGGDLTARLLVPALARLRVRGLLPGGFAVVAVDRADTDTEAVRARVEQQVRRLDPDVPRDALHELLAALEYRRGDVTSPRDVAAAVDRSRPLAAYLALPPAVFAPAIRALGAAGLPAGSRIVLEKPFGTDLASAQTLNRELADVVPEEAVHRVDHFLAKQTVQNLLGLRFANRVFEPLWTREHVARVEIVWNETLTVEGRAGYYDHTGALLDMIQNHLLQLLCLVAMEPPPSLSQRDLRDRKVDVLRAVRRLSPAEAGRATRRARYTAGRIGAREVPSYVDEPGVDPARETETWAEVALTIDTWRWAGVPFVLRSGKALSRDLHEIAVHFQRVPHLAFGQEPEPRANVLRLGVDPDTMTLEIAVNGPGDPFTLEQAALEAALAPDELPAYAHVLLDVLAGDPTLSVRGDEAEEQWRIVEPILSVWESGRPPLLEYPAGSQGPAADAAVEPGTPLGSR